MPWLVLLSGKILELEAGRSYAIGRDPSCELPVDDTAASRRHARVSVVAGQGAFVEDNGSLNGTQLDGRTVVAREPLRHGARIRVGNTFVLYRDGGRPDESSIHALRKSPFDTVALGSNGTAAPTARVGLSGSLAAIQLVEVLQTIHHAGLGGTLELVLREGTGRLEFEAGSVRAASFGGVRGVPALFAVALRREGLFRLRERAGPLPEANVTIPTPQLLFELCRVLDEHDSDGGAPPPGGHPHPVPEASS